MLHVNNNADKEKNTTRVGNIFENLLQGAAIVLRCIFDPGAAFVALSMAVIGAAAFIGSKISSMFSPPKESNTNAARGLSVAGTSSGPLPASPNDIGNSNNLSHGGKKSDTTIIGEIAAARSRSTSGDTVKVGKQA